LGGADGADAGVAATQGRDPVDDLGELPVVSGQFFVGPTNRLGKPTDLGPTHEAFAVLRAAWPPADDGHQASLGQRSFCRRPVVVVAG
jgi:hypothetical protein